MRFLFCVIISVGLFSCSRPQGFDYRRLENFTIDSLGFDKSTLKMNLVYFNPNNFGVNLRHVDCDIFVNHSFLGKYALDTTMHIARRSEFSLPSSVQVDMRNIYKNSLNVLFNQEIQIDIKGTTRVGKGGIFVNVPFTYSTKQKLSLF